MNRNSTFASNPFFNHGGWETCCGIILKLHNPSCTTPFAHTLLLHKNTTNAVNISFLRRSCFVKLLETFAKLFLAVPFMLVSIWRFFEWLEVMKAPHADPNMYFLSPQGIGTAAHSPHGPLKGLK